MFIIRTEGDARKVNKLLKVPGARDALGENLADALAEEARDKIKYERSKVRFYNSLTEKERELLIKVEGTNHTLFQQSGLTGLSRYVLVQGSSNKATITPVNRALVSGLIRRGIITVYHNESSRSGALLKPMGTTLGNGVLVRHLSVINERKAKKKK